MLDETDNSVIIEHVIKYNANFTNNKVKTEIALVKEVLGNDWVFATDLKMRDIKRYVQVYRRRWNIETMFRVHDEARIKSKSKIPIIRLFYFLISLLLIFIWSLFEKNKTTFKRFIIILFDESKNIAPQKLS